MTFVLSCNPSPIPLSHFLKKKDDLLIYYACVPNAKIKKSFLRCDKLTGIWSPSLLFSAPTNNWYFLFDGRLETQVCNEPYNLTLICSWNLPLKKAKKNWPLHRWHYHRFSLYIHYSPLCEQTHQELIFKRCTKSFAPFKNCSLMSFLVRVYINCEDLLKVNIMTASKINPLYQTCQAAFYSASALKKKKILYNFLLSHFETQGQTLNWTITAQAGTEQMDSFFLFLSSRISVKFSVVWSHLKTLQNHGLKWKVWTPQSPTEAQGKPKWHV